MELEVGEQETDPVADDLFQGSTEQVCFWLSCNSISAHIMQIALRLNTLMSRILQFQSAQKKSCKDLRFRVVKRNQNGISRCKQFEKYSGPDDATVQFLQKKKNRNLECGSYSVLERTIFRSWNQIL